MPRWTLALLLACAPPPTDPPPAALPAVPAAAVARLTDAQWRASVRDLLGVEFTEYLPSDYVLHGHASVGASTLATGPLEWEQYEAAAWRVADRALGSADDRARQLGCQLEGAAVDDAVACLRAWGAGLAARAWRRPVEVDELDLMAQIARPPLLAGDPGLAARAVAALVLTSPWFLFRVETGEPDPALPGAWRYSDTELAARLSLLLLGHGPDEELRRAAEERQLGTSEEVRAQADRLLATAEARAAVDRFWSESLELSRLDGATKFATAFPFFDAALRQAMVREVRWLVLDTTLDRDVDLRELFTTTQTLVDPALAELYGLAPVEGEVVTELPPERGGLLGRGAIASIYSNPYLTSPTRRGKFIRTRLLCHSVQPPPPGLSAVLEEVQGGGSTRDRIERHADSPACAPCHDVIDPPGFGMENLDAVGRWRDQDGGKPVDARGELDGVAFDGVAELGAAVANHPDLPGCLALDLWRYASGQPETEAQLPDIEALGARMAEGGYRWRELLLDVLSADAFRRPAPGEVAAPPEVCDGRDDDGDGAVDEVARACVAEGRPGVQTCAAGAWAACAAVPAAVAPTEVTP